MYIKNVENELITTGIHAFETDKTYIFSSALIEYFLSIEKLFLQVTMLRADSLIDRDANGLNVNVPNSRHCCKVFKNAELVY